MKINILVITALAGAVLSGCATQSSNTFQAFQPTDLNALVKSGQLVQKTNTFLVLNDSSSSMGKTYQGASDVTGNKLDVEKNLLYRFNKTIPSMPLSSGLRSFGFGPCLDWSATQIKQPLQEYSAAGFESAINTLTCASGGTPSADAVAAAQTDLSAATGQIALIVLSDGIDEVSPLAATHALKEQYGDRLCVYTVWVGNEEERAGEEVLQEMAEAGGCGFNTTAAAISNPQGMTEFVKNVFLKPGTPDNDEDKDGVIDSKDKCPHTPKGAIVDKDGCWAFHGILFDTNSDKVKSKYSPLIQNAVKVLGLNPGLRLQIEGHTDSRASDAYNQKLSERRAASVKRELVNQGVADSRLTTVGYGESRPVASNDTPEGRAYNRRVEYKTN